ncbi:unnamed protein product [Rhizoctonia solani]|uniref:Uncharacterized protein n=1 Tax=Rhizoctonia solani TaxID=456999 RepID=A0A8H3G9Y4_9AGAM|nr:unnamed protein product [Rhizoctonia solani]
MSLNNSSVDEPQTNFSLGALFSLISTRTQYKHIWVTITHPMATRSERQEITALHRASNGQGNSSHDSRKKRPREDDASSGGGVRRRAGGFENPYGGIGRSNLQERRTNGGRTLKRDSSPSMTSTDSRSNTSKAPIGYAAFGPRSGVLDSHGPPASAIHSGQSLPHHPSSVRQSSPTISKEINDKMDGAGEGEGEGEDEGEGRVGVVEILGSRSISGIEQKLRLGLELAGWCDRGLG